MRGIIHQYGGLCLLMQNFKGSLLDRIKSCPEKVRGIELDFRSFLRNNACNSNKSNLDL